MPPSLFISYARTEAPFVDSLLDNLEDLGLKVWLDYHSLIPARSWVDEIYRGITEADVVLLVISKSSLVSSFASAEVETAYFLKKRIILLIFEAVKLPPELEGYEWIDFRGSFKKGLSELLRQLETPVRQKKGPPQKGFKAPAIVWATFFLSLLMSFFALPTFWTLYPPYYLIPLPYRILKRDFSYFHVTSALAMLPFAEFFSAGLTGTASRTLLAVTMLSFILSPLLFLLLRSSGMRRWGKPVASRPQFANLYQPHIERPQPVSFTVESAPEDQKFAEALIAGLRKYQHHYVEEARQAQVVFVLISRFNQSTTHDPEGRAVYPVMVQSVKLTDEKLQRIQWIDFRRGLGNLDALAQLLPEPEGLFKALGIFPLGDQVVLPLIVRALINYLLVLGSLVLGGMALSVFHLRSHLSWRAGAFLLFLWALFLLTIYFTARSLSTRTGISSSLLRLILIFIWLNILSFTQYLTLAVISVTGPKGSDTGSFQGILTLLTPLIGLLIILPLVARHWKDLWRWFPRKRGRPGNLTQRRV